MKFKSRLLILILATFLCIPFPAYATTPVLTFGEDGTEEYEKVVEILGDYGSFGTFYIDEKNSYVLGISKEDGKSNLIKEKLKVILPEGKIKIIKVKYSKNTLEEVALEIYKMFPELKKTGSKLLSTEIDEEAGKIIVKAHSLQEQEFKKLISRYGEILEIIVDESLPVEEVTSRTSNMSVLGGGIAAKRGTSSFTITATVGSSGQRYLLTVGHSLSGDGSTVINQYSQAVGVDYAMSTRYDIGLIKVTDSSRKISNKLYRYSANDYAITGISTVTQGGTYCKAGITTGHTCSKVLSTSYNGLYEDTIKLENPNWSFQDNGDSGAPLFASNYLYGIMSTKSSTKSDSAFATATKIDKLGKSFGGTYYLNLNSTDY